MICGSEASIAQFSYVHCGLRAKELELTLSRAIAQSRAMAAIEGAHSIGTKTGGATLVFDRARGNPEIEPIRHFVDRGSSDEPLKSAIDGGSMKHSASKAAKDMLLGDGRGGFLAAAIAGLITISFGLGAFVAGEKFELKLNPTDIIALCGAVATTVAAVAAAASARFTRTGAEAARASAEAGAASARAAQDTVDEMREARRQLQRPWLTIEPNFVDLRISSFDETKDPAIEGRLELDPMTYGRPQFDLINHSDAPALEIRVEFELSETNVAQEIDPGFAHIGVRLGPAATLPWEPHLMVLTLGRPIGNGTGFAIRNRASVFRSSCGPRQSKIIDFPKDLIGAIMLRAVQYYGHRIGDRPFPKMYLSIKLNIKTIENEDISRDSIFEIFPYCYGPSRPLSIFAQIKYLETK